MAFDESRSDSPNDQHHAILTFDGEIRFGPCYFSLSINDRSFGNRIFGQCVLWSPDSSTVCLQEWHTTNYSAGPITSLLLVRPDDWTYFAFPRIDRGWASPNHFLDDSLVLAHTEDHLTAKAERETDLEKITDWSPLQ